MKTAAAELSSGGAEKKLKGAVRTIQEDLLEELDSIAAYWLKSSRHIAIIELLKDVKEKILTAESKEKGQAYQEVVKNLRDRIEPLGPPSARERIEEILKIDYEDIAAFELTVPSFLQGFFRGLRRRQSA